MTDVLHHVLKAGWIAGLLFCATAVLAEDSWVLTGSDFRRSNAAVESLDPQGVRIVTADGAKSLRPLDEVLRLERASMIPLTKPKLILFLQQGDRLAGDAATLKDEILIWTNASIGELKLPLSKLRGISRLDPPSGLDSDRREDQVVLSNHDVVRGVVAGIEDGKILVQTGGDTVPVPFASADSIFFATTPRPSTAMSVSWRLQFADTSVLTASAIAIKDGKLSFQLPGGNKVADSKTTFTANLSTLQSVEQLNGPVSWLSDRPATSDKQTPFNSKTVYPARMNLNVFGKPLRVGAQSFEKGIGVHANSVLSFPLDGTYKVFRTRYAIDTNSDASKAVVSVRILLDGRVVHEEKNFRAFKLSPVVTVELSSAKELTLEVIAEGPTDTQDRLDWIESALIRTAVKSTATAPSPAGGASDKR